MDKEYRYLVQLRWYSVLNYTFALGEQIALWNYASRTFFWWALVLNILGVLSIAWKIGKLEKKLGLD
jgi:hypothetical protein